MFSMILILFGGLTWDSVRTVLSERGLTFAQCAMGTYGGSRRRKQIVWISQGTENEMLTCTTNVMLGDWTAAV